MLDNAVKDRGSPFRIPVFICGNQSDFDGRIVVLRKSDQSNNLVQYHSDIRSDKIEKLKANKNAAMLFYDKDETTGQLYFLELNDKRLRDKLVKYSASIPESFFNTGVIKFL